MQNPISASSRQEIKQSVQSLLLQSQACRNCQKPGHRIRDCVELCMTCQPSCGMTSSRCPQYLATASPGNDDRNGRQRKKVKPTKPAPRCSTIPPTKGVEQCCSECHHVFASKTKLFKHLEEVHNILGSSADKGEKVVLLVGWMSSDVRLADDDDADVWKKDGTLNADWVNTDAEDKTLELLTTAIASVDDCALVKDAIRGLSRSSSCAQRASYSLGQESSCNASCETFTVQIKKLLGRPVGEWLAAINSFLPKNIRVLGRQALPAAAHDFHAEMLCSQRLYEYMLPLSHIMPPLGSYQGPDIHEIRKLIQARDDAEAAIAAAALDVETKICAKATATNDLETEPLSQVFRDRTWGKMDALFPIETEEGRSRVDYFRRLKLLLKFVAGKRSFHNFVTGGASPDELTVKRRLDRMYHKDLLVSGEEHYVVFSLSGDAFLRGQIRKIIGTVLCVMRGWLPLEYLAKLFSLNDVFDTPMAPGWPLYLAETKYDRWEAKYLIRLDPRRIPLTDGFNGADLEEIGSGEYRQGGTGDLYTKHRNQCRAMAETSFASASVNTQLCKNGDFLSSLTEINEWKKYIREQLIARFESGNGRWLERMEQQCKILRHKYETLNFLNARDLNSYQTVSLSMPVVTVYSLNPLTEEMVYHRVLSLLLEADVSGKWPATSLGRQKVIEGSSMTHSPVGSIGGSFSVGIYPKPLVAPKGNALFPDLVNACFLLERIITPHRPPSSTIAINRHAQFRPHRDSGAGNGQSDSLIVALGDYKGGELVVEGIAHDIRYKPIEFDGWMERHWTLPFVGNRYSLVWFTPLGVCDEDYFWLPDIKAQCGY